VSEDNLQLRLKANRLAPENFPDGKFSEVKQKKVVG